jgi:hypothetical protein
MLVLPENVSDSISNFLRAGRKWNILKKETKMIPKEVEEYADMMLNVVTPSEKTIKEMIVPTNPR